MSSRDLGIVVLVVLGALVLLPVLGMALGGGWGMMGPGMMGPGMMGRWGYGPGAGVGVLTFLLLVAGVVLVVLAFTRKEGRPADAVEILKTRLAKGEITKEQFEELKRVLQ